MPSIYIHIPFCRRKCLYCDFYSVAQIDKIEGFIAALMLEIAREKDFLRNMPINTIYFGGGSPGILSGKQISMIIEELGRFFDVTQVHEITLEINPEDASPEFLHQLLQVGINRLSIGVQSTHNHHLQFLGRRHSAGDAMQALKNAKNAGFSNISADIIFGVPGLTLHELSESLDELTQLEVSHISAYLLTAEGNTLLTRRIRENRIIMPDDEECTQQYHLLCRKLKQSGFEHYEISNFCKPGFHSQHNSSYWYGAAYLGLGPAAHSYNGKNRRRANTADIKSYIENNMSGTIGYTEDLLSETDIVNEYIMTHLRTSKGIDINNFVLRFGKPRLVELLNMAREKIENAQLIKNGTNLCIPENQMLVSDFIISDLFQ